MNAVWLTKRTLRTIVEAPDKWFDLFAINQPQDIRKFGDSTNSTLTYRVAAVLDAVEEKRYFRRKTVSEIVSEAIERSGEAQQKAATGGTQ